MDLLTSYNAMVFLDVHELIARPSLVFLVVRNVALLEENVSGASVHTVTIILSRFHKSFSKWPLVSVSGFEGTNSIQTGFSMSTKHTIRFMPRSSHKLSL